MIEEVYRASERVLRAKTPKTCLGIQALNQKRKYGACKYVLTTERSKVNRPMGANPRLNATWSPSVCLITCRKLQGQRTWDAPPRLNDFGVSISLSRNVLESEDMSQENEDVSGPQHMIKRGMTDRKNN